MIFLPEETVFPDRGNVFFSKCFIRGSGNGLPVLVQTNSYTFFQTLLPEKAEFLNESFIPAIGERFSSLMETVTLLEHFFLIVETVTAMSDETYSRWWKVIFWLVETIFFHCLIFFKESFIPISGNEFFSPKEQHCVLFRAFFPASEKHLNYKKH